MIQHIETYAGEHYLGITKLRIRILIYFKWYNLTKWNLNWKYNKLWTIFKLISELEMCSFNKQNKVKKLKTRFLSGVLQC